jgi:hypothetical protein
MKPASDKHSHLNVDIITVESWAHFVELAGRFDQFPLPPYCGFRGHPDADYSLTPSLVRRLRSLGLPEEVALDVEKGSIGQFKAQAHQFLPISLYLDIKDGSLGWLTVMQHHHAPTRLLDWTESVYVALYFAVIGQRELDGAVWVFRHSALLDAFPNEPKAEADAKYFFEPGGPSALYRFWWDCKSPRMIAQQGFFTWSPNILASHDEILSASLKRTPGDGMFAKLVIPAALKPHFAAKLHSMNVAANALFPGIDGVGWSIEEIIWLSGAHRLTNMPFAR